MIYFVGAGAGAPDLITVRGRKLLEEADVVVYAGSLVSKEHLDYCKPGCEIYNSALLNLEEIVSILKDAEARGLLTVRLHTGDPSLYGAIREQMEAMDELGIDYEVCPGVSSYAAAAAALKAEYTVPSVSQTLIITRMAGRTPVPEEESLHSLAAHQASMAIFLSSALSEEVQRELLAGGLSPSTPCAIAYKVSWPDQSLLYCHLEDLHDTMSEAAISNFALILVGEFLGERFEPSQLYDPYFGTAFRHAQDQPEISKE
ncbi:MAG: precorrin-4 C(11)-methyltransferase [Eubacteriales bacterium]|nr:precorrin-4 C(11)-methyltransferase [Eubacteriales bacterium]